MHRRLVLSFAVVVLHACGSESKTLPPDPNPGAPCVSNDDCVGLACVADERFPGGYCSSLCDEAECPTGSRCVSGVGATLCLAECTSQEECREGYQCWAGTCRPACAGDADCGSAGATCTEGRCTGAECLMPSDCGAGLTCISGRCIPAPPDAGAGRAVGEPCTLAGECTTGICLPAELGGTCAAACTDRDSCVAFELSCSPVGIDLHGDGSGDVVVSACVESNPSGQFLAGACTTSADCESRACLDGQCQEGCDDDGDCLPGQICTDVTFGGLGTYRGCGYPPLSGSPEVLDVTIDTIDVNTSIPSARVSLAIPNDAVSVTLTARRVGGDNLALAFIDVWDPSSTHVFDYADLVSWNDQPVRWLPLDSEEQISMLVPNSTPDRITFMRGRYGLTVAGLSDGMSTGGTEVELGARIKRATGGDVSGGTLSLNVFLVGVGLTAATATTHSRLQSALSELGTVLGGAGIGIGTIEYVEVTGADATRYSVIDSSDGPASEMAELLRLSAGRTNEALNVFLVRGISAGAGESGGIALGVAGGIPGPPGVHGTMHSGVVVSFDTMVVGTDHRVVAQIMAHEIGHYLGLFHNCERAGACAPGRGPTETNPCAPFGGGDVLEDTSCAHGDNLLWWALGGDDGDTYNVALTAGQGFVMRRSAVVR